MIRTLTQSGDLRRMLTLGARRRRQARLDEHLLILSRRPWWTRFAGDSRISTTLDIIEFGAALWLAALATYFLMRQ